MPEGIRQRQVQPQAGCIRRYVFVVPRVATHKNRSFQCLSEVLGSGSYQDEIPIVEVLIPDRGAIPRKLNAHQTE